VVCLLVAVPVAIRDVFALGYRISCHVNFNIDAGGCARGGPTVIFRQGANIDLACQVVAWSAFATLLALVAVRRGRGLAVLLCLAGGALMVAIGLVLADSATYIARIPDTGYKEVSHVPGLVAVPAVALGFLLLRAFGAWNRIERPDRTPWPEPAS
jgi:hypothetical protein